MKLIGNTAVEFPDVGDAGTLRVWGADYVYLTLSCSEPAALTRKESRLLRKVLKRYEKLISESDEG